MSLENQQFNNQQQTRHLHDHCHRYMHHHVLATGTDGQTFDGIIVNVDMDNVTILVGEDVLDRDDQQDFDRQFGGYGGYGGYRPRRRFRRYRPRSFPFATLAALSLLPYALPGYPPYYPYYPPYPYY